MKKLLVGATLVALGAGTVGAGAMSDVQLRGSDGIKDLTFDILANCPGADPIGAAGLVYINIGDTGGDSAESALRKTGIPGTVHDGVNVPGGCSDGGDADTLLECQTVAPMSRFLQAASTCAFPQLPTSGPKGVRSAALAEGISFALEGAVVVGAPLHAATCNDDPGVSGETDDCDKATAGNVGMVYGRTITVNDENTTPGLQCPACTGSSYTLGQGRSDGWKDVLRIVYTGAVIGTTSSAASIADRDCDGDLRHTLVNHWGNLFQNDCSGGNCVQLKHAFRRDTESGTSDTFLSLIGAPSFGTTDGGGEASAFCDVSQSGDDWGGTNGAVAHNLDTQSNRACTGTADCGTGGLECVTGFCTATNEFPGGFGPARGAFGTHLRGYLPPYKSDNQDNDPIRRLCDGTFDVNAGGTEPAVTATEQVCRARRPRKLAGGFEASGTLGLVLPINPPPIGDAAYPTKPCAFGKFNSGGPAPVTGGFAPNDPEYPAATRAITKVERCPNGDIPTFLTPTGGKCFVPTALDGDVACINGRNNLPSLTVDSPQLASGSVDTTDRLDAVKTGVTGGSSGLWAGDGRVYNLHLYFTDQTDGKIKYRTIKRYGADVPIVGAFYRIHTTRTLDGTAVGCRENTGSKQIGCLVQASPCSIGYGSREARGPLLKGTAVPLKLNALEPTNACVRKLISGGTPYPLSRQLYLNTMAGFENVAGQELELSKCFAGGVSGGLSALEFLIANHDFVSRGDLGDPLRAPACRDFQQQGATAAQGCNQPLVTTIACSSAADCPLGNSCNFGSGVCEAANDACTNNPAGIPIVDPIVP